MGENWLNPLTGEPNTCLMGRMNGNSPLTFDATMLGAARRWPVPIRARWSPLHHGGGDGANRPCGAIAVTLAEAMAGMAFLQLVKPGAPVIFGSFVTTLSMQSGAPTYGTPETVLIKNALIALARRLGRCLRALVAALCASKIADAGGQQIAHTLRHGDGRGQFRVSSRRAGSRAGWSPALCEIRDGLRPASWG